jgi:hypothetical protein
MLSEHLCTCLQYQQDTCQPLWDLQGLDMSTKFDSLMECSYVDVDIVSITMVYYVGICLAIEPPHVSWGAQMIGQLKTMLSSLYLTLSPAS